MKVNRAYPLKELVDGLDVTIQGDPHCLISGVAPIQQAEAGHITFLTNPRYRKYIETTQASAVIVSEADAPLCRQAAVVGRNPYYVYARIAQCFAERSHDEPGIHASCVVGENSHIHSTASIAPGCMIGRSVSIGPRVVLGPSCVIGDGVVIDEETVLDARVTLYARVRIGRRVRLSSGVVIGSDGFGFANDKGTWHSIPQLGSVEIGDDVFVGAGTTIDRGAIEDTVIEQGVKLDNLIQVGHNVRIGEHTIIAGCVAIAGSVTIGKHCMIGGATCFAGHITVCDQAVVTGMTAVTKSITEPGIYSSGIVGAVPNHEFRKNNARFHRLENLMQKVKTLEAAFKALNERD